MSDLLTLRSIDLAVVQSDVLAYFQRSNSVPGIESQLQYIAKLYSEEFHVLSRMQYLCLAELEGRKVNFGPKGGGASITAEAVFESQRINVLPLYLDQTEALEKLKTGEIDATVYVDGKPSRVFDHIHYTDRVHFLDVDYGDRLQRDYLPALMTNEDYPHLIAPSETVSTIAVSNVLAYYNSRPSPERIEAGQPLYRETVRRGRRFETGGRSGALAASRQMARESMFTLRWPAGSATLRRKSGSANNPPSGRASAVGTNETAPRAPEAIISATQATSPWQKFARDQDTSPGDGAAASAKRFISAGKRFSLNKTEKNSSTNFCSGTMAPRKNNPPAR